MAEEDEACLAVMEAANAWLAGQAELERRLRGGWLALAETRRHLGYAYATATALDEREGLRPVLTVQGDGAQLSLQRDPDAKPPALFGALPPRPAKAAGAEFAGAAEAALRLLEHRAHLEACQLRLRELREKRKAAVEKEE